MKKRVRNLLSVLKAYFCNVLRMHYFRFISDFLEDANRFWHNSGRNDETGGLETAQARIVVGYHIIEKGLTMPNRHLAFGQNVLSQLMSDIEDFKTLYGKLTQQVAHAVAVVHEYQRVHVGYEFKDAQFKGRVSAFCLSNPNQGDGRQMHTSKSEFYASVHNDFKAFAQSRHTVRHYNGLAVPIERIRAAVELAQSAPSACNRQHTRVKCLTGKSRIGKVLELQGGNRGFGHLADKVLVVTGDLRDCLGVYERNDAFINGGIFLMNLCYALHYYQIAHCILSCSLGRERVHELRKLLGVPASEVLIALLSIGNAPEEFDVARSPRRPVDEIFTIEEN